VHHWVLLLLGLTQVPAPAAIIVVVWFFLLSNRRTDLQVHDLYFAARQLVIVGYTFVAFLCLVWAVDAGLLGDPAMEIAGPMCSSSTVRFFVDRTSEALPTASVVSLPLWVVSRAHVRVGALARSVAPPLDPVGLERLRGGRSLPLPWSGATRCDAPST
jgi:hypothetical protein